MGEGTGQILEKRRPEQLERDVQAIRDDLTGIVTEMERRGRELIDWRLQVRRHSTGLVIAGGVVALLVGAAVGLSIWFRRRRERPGMRVRRLRRAFNHLIEDPDAIVHHEPSVGRKVLAAFAGTAASTFAKALSERAVGPLRSTA